MNIFSFFNVCSAIVLAAMSLLYAVVTRPAAPPEILGLNSGGQKLTVRAHLYFSNTELTDFSIEERSILVKSEDQPRIPQIVLEEFLRKPSQGTLSLVPSNMPVPTLFVRSKHFFLDIPKEWRKLSLGFGGELILLCGMTRTLLDLGDYRDVMFTVGGQPATTLLGHVNLMEPLDAQSCQLG